MAPRGVKQEEREFSSDVTIFRTSTANAFNLFGPALPLSGKPPILPKDSKITPNFIRSQIPERLFKRDPIKGFMHIARDLTVAALFFYGATHIERVPFLFARCALWALYWFCQGSVLTGVWVLAHECGHQSFSDSKALNDSVGWVLHSFLLVPYHSWRITHSNHHSNTCSMEDDEVFVPSSRSDYTEMVKDTPFYNALDIAKMLLFGWPAYLAVNAAGPKKYVGKKNSHFDPQSELFETRSYVDIVTSDIGFFGMIGILAWACVKFGTLNVASYYFVPYLVVNLYLVLITYLQHTDSNVPHYRKNEFTWIRGAFSTVDRSFGWLLDDALHHIADTHVVHHLFSTMPFYNAIEATGIVKKIIGDHYLRDNSPIPAALWRSWRSARFVEDTGDILFMKDTEELNRGFEGKKGK